MQEKLKLHFHVPDGAGSVIGIFRAGTYNYVACSYMVFIIREDGLHPIPFKGGFREE